MSKNILILSAFIFVFLIPKAKSTETKAIDEKLLSLETYLSKDSYYESIWRWGWIGSYSANIFLKLNAINEEATEKAKVIHYTGLGRSGVGLIAKIFYSQKAKNNYFYFSNLPQSNEIEKKSKLKIGEGLLLKNAQRSSERYTLKPRLAGIALNAISTFAIWKWGLKKDIAPNIISAFAGYEFLIWSYPWQARSHYDSYHNDYLTSQASFEFSLNIVDENNISFKGVKYF